MQVYRPLFILFSVILLVASVQATDLTIAVEDDSTGTAVVDASVYIDGEFAGRTDDDGEISYAHTKTASLHVRVTRTGYEEWTGLVSPTQTSLSIELSRMSETLTINLYDGSTLQGVPGALVMVRNDDYTASQLTDSSGKAVFTVETQNTYTVEVKASHYDTLFRTVPIGEAARSVQYWLFRSDQFVLQVVDAATQKPIATANVTVGGRSMGATDADGRLTFNLDREQKYSIRVEKENYQPFSQERLISADDAVLTIPLSKATYPLFVSAFDASRRPVEGAGVYINGTNKGTTDSYGRLGISSVEAGPHLVEVKCSGYEDWSEVRELAEGGEDVVASLVNSKASVRIIVEDADHHILAGAAVSIDENATGTTDELGSYTTPLRTAATYNFTAALEGYRGASVQGEIPFGASDHTVTILLEKNFDMTVPLAGLIGLVALGVVYVGVRKVYGDRRGRRPRRRLG